MNLQNLLRRRLPLGGCFLIAGLPLCAQTLEEGFRQPPREAQPRTWWHWISGNVSREGITLDLEAMKRVGIAEAQIFSAEQGPQGPVKTLSEEWKQLTRHAITEANRLGMELAFQNCPGWSLSGGPWVTPEESMQFVYTTEAQVTGGQKIKLALPPQDRPAWRDIAVWAFPSMAGDGGFMADAKLSASTGGKDLANAVDGNLKTYAVLPKGDSSQFLQLEFPQPVTFGSVCVQIFGCKGDVMVSEDGGEFRKIGQLNTSTMIRGNYGCYASFAPVKARFWRVVFGVNPKSPEARINELAFGGARLNLWESKAAFNADAKSGDPTPWDIPAEMVINPKSMVNLSDKISPDGTLEWDAPAGKWTVIRFGHASNGSKNHPADETGRGLECDKLSRQAVTNHFNNGLMGMVIKEAGPLTGKTLKYMLADSWEAGCLNWTPAMREEFQKRRGYDPIPWLPALTGRVVGSAEQTERFLWDFRRVIADLTAENHYGVLKELANRHGIEFYAEAPGIYTRAVADELQCKARTDIPMGEAWGEDDMKEAASAAHINGLRWAAAEAYTAWPKDAGWKRDPFSLKAQGDRVFCLGINRFAFHRYAHQPFTDKYPGVSMGPWGLNFERTQTWWEQGRAWMDYLSRCQWLLSQGQFVADVCFFYGEEVPISLNSSKKELPKGYSYDACDAETLQKMEFRDGCLILPGGMSYRVLLLPKTDRMTPRTLTKIHDLVRAGATIIGERVSQSPSLQNGIQADEEIKKLSEELWGPSMEQAGDRAVGKGRVLSGKPLDQWMPQLGLAPDFSTASAESSLRALHRRTPEGDLYFVSNQKYSALEAECTFRVAGRIPELWHPDSGVIETAPLYRQAGGLTTVPLRFDPAGSVFVVFRKDAAKDDPLVSVQRDGHPGGAAFDLSRPDGGAALLTAWQPGVYTASFASGKQWKGEVAAVAPAAELQGPWALSFPPKWGAPAKVTLEKLISWTDHPDEGVKYFSGTATYATEFQLDPKRLGAGKALRLDLGEVKNLAEVTVNGKNLGILWKPPFAVNLAGVTKPGRNTLEVKITNLWPNRMIGDEKLPPEQRHTWSTYNPYKADSLLLPSGLIGPVTVQYGQTVRIGP